VADDDKTKTDDQVDDKTDDQKDDDSILDVKDDDKTDDDDQKDDDQDSVLDQKTDDSDDDDGKSKDGNADGAPEKYELTVPEGAPEGMEVDTAALEMAEPVFRQLGLTNDQAQELVKLDFERAKAEADKAIELRKTNLAAIKADKELGGNAYKTTLSNSKRVVGEFFDQALVDKLVLYGLDVDPDMVRAVNRIAKRFGEDTASGRDHSRTSEKTDEEIMYGEVDKPSVAAG
jgi:hypothetical protein